MAALKLMRSTWDEDADPTRRLKDSGHRKAFSPEETKVPEERRRIAFHTGRNTGIFVTPNRWNVWNKLLIWSHLRRLFACFS